MAETEVIEKPAVQEENTESVQVQATPFGNNSWSESLPEIKEVSKVESTPETIEVKKDDQKISDEIDLYVKEFGKSKDEFKKEYDELVKFRQEPPKPEEIKYENEDSRKVHQLLKEGKIKDVIDVYNKQERISNAIGLEVNKDTAADIIKLNIHLKYPTLTQQQIDFQYKQEYGLPKEPVMKDTDDEIEFKERHDNWKEQVENIQMKSVIAATMAKPELEKSKTTIVLPEINPQPKVEQPSQESLEAQQKAAENFRKLLESNYAKAEGFSTKVKDESVELPVSFKIPDEDKVAIKERLMNGFDLVGYFEKRWFDENNNPKIESMVSDLFQLENPDKILSGIANNAANERLSNYQKSIKNIDLKNQTTVQNTFQPNQNGNQNANPFSQGSWSEKPPVFNN